MEFWQKYIVENLYKPFSWAILSIVSIPILGGINGLLTGLDVNIQIRATLCSGLFIITIAVWLYKYLHLPRNRNNSIGIVVSLYCENKDQEIRLKNDFLHQLKLSLAKLEEVKCYFISLPNHKAEKIAQANKPEEICIRWNHKIRGHYFIYGSIKQRSDGKSKYLIDLAGLVTHAPVPQEVSTTIRSDFNRILPTSISFEDAFELGGFSLTADLVSHSVKLIVGIAAMVSGDLFLAHKLHTALLKEVGNIPKDIHGRWKERLDKFIDDEENIIAVYYYNNGEIDESKKWLANLINRSPRHYGAWLVKGIQDFNDGQINQAINDIKQARQYAKNTFEWRYSLAFLLFWEGKYDDALEVCFAIRKTTYPGEESTAVQVAEFINAQIKQHPDKNELHYWLGFIQYEKLGNLPISLQCFESFLEAGDKNMKKMRDKANAYLVEIKRLGGWS